MAKPRSTVPAVGELTECLEHSTLSLHHQALRGDVPGRKVGRHWRFRKDAIDVWIETGSSPTSAYVKARAKAKRRR